MKNAAKRLAVTVLLVCTALLFGCAGNMEMQNVNSGLEETSAQTSASGQEDGLVNKSMLVLPDRSLGLEPTPSIRQGDMTSAVAVFHLRLTGEWFPGRIRWNSWTIDLENNTEHFGQFIFYGMHPSGYYFGINVIDGQVLSGITAILSTAGDYIYSPLGNKELPVELEKFMNVPGYRRVKIIEVNTQEDGHVFNVSSLAKFPDFKWHLKAWNPLKTPDGYLLTPYGEREVAEIRGINPQYSYFEKLIGTGRFAVIPTTDPLSLAFANSMSFLMDMIGAINAPSTGADYNSVISRREMSFQMEYFLRLAQNEVQKRNDINTGLFKKLEALSAGR